MSGHAARDAHEHKPSRGADESAGGVTRRSHFTRRPSARSPFYVAADSHYGK